MKHFSFDEKVYLEEKTCFVKSVPTSSNYNQQDLKECQACLMWLVSTCHCERDGSVLQKLGLGLHFKSVAKFGRDQLLEWNEFIPQIHAEYTTL